MARDDPMMRFRAPQELKSKIEEAAANNSRSLNAEIVHRLEQSFRNDVFIKADDNMSGVNFTLAMEVFEWKKELLDEVESNPSSTEADKLIAAHEFEKAQRHMRYLFASAQLSEPLKTELAKRKDK